MIKTSSSFTKYPLEKLFNLILQSGTFPTSWSKRIITALHKSGNKDDPSNYRGIWLLNFSNNHKILHRSQIGVLPRHKKAFDSIWHQSLPYYLLKYNIGGTFYKKISSMYSHSICCVKDNYAWSEFFNYDKGVRQGCILSPLLFNLYLNELPFTLNNNAKDSILLPDVSHLNCLLYADDLLLISTSAEGLQQSLDRLSKYCQDWLLKINPTKTKVIVFQ